MMMRGITLLYPGASPKGRGGDRASLVLGLLSATAVLAGCSDLESLGSPEQVYRATFDAVPSPEIQGLQGEGRAFRDSGHAYLKFVAPEAIFRGLLGNAFVVPPPEEFVKQIRQGGRTGVPPAWWDPPASATFRAMSTSFHPTFSQGEAFAWYDLATSTAYLHWSGID